MAPRGGKRVVLSASDLQLVADELRERLPVAIIDLPEQPRTLRELMPHLGATRREQIRRGAIALSGTSDRSSRAYLTARRLFERATTTAKQRRPGTKPSTIENVRRALRRPHLPTGVGLTVRMRAAVFYERKVATMPAGNAQYVRSERLGAMRARLREGDELEAARALLDAWVLAYGLNTAADATGIIGNIESIDVRLAE